MISFEALFDALRAEKSKQELQSLDQDFYKNIALYVKDKQDFIKYKARQVLTLDEFEKEQQQLMNIKRIIRDLYDRRVEKIATLALNASRISIDIVDMNLLLNEEKPLFNMLFRGFKQSRDTVLEPLLSGSVEQLNQTTTELTKKSAESTKSSIELETHKPLTHGITPDIKPDITLDITNKDHKLDITNKDHKDHKTDTVRDTVAKTETATTSSEELIMVRFVREVPRFSDRNGNILGPFDVNDVAALPKYIADLLISKGRAEVFMQ